MKEIFKKYLFEKNFLVNEGDKKEENIFEVLTALFRLFAIRITSGALLVDNSMIRYAAEQLGENVPEAFYRGFPKSVRSLTKDEFFVGLC